MPKRGKHSRSSEKVPSSRERSIRKLELTMMLLAFLLLVTMVLLGLLALPIIFPPIDAVLKKSSLDVSDLSSLKFQTDFHSCKESENQRKQWIEVLSWEPRAFIYHSFLRKDECEYLISLAKSHMQNSTLVDSTTGKSKDSRFQASQCIFPRFLENENAWHLTEHLASCSLQVRTSSGMFLKRKQDKIISSIEQRIADFTFIPMENGEGLQVLHHKAGQKYEPHFDYFLDEFNAKNGGQRIATVLMYLSDVEEGGETVFPSVKVNESSVPYWNELSQCGKTGLAVRPKMGDALLFWSMRPDATLDPMSLHGLLCFCSH
ncbi:putative prolyl 4-hydroxylase 3 [Nymphaea thermarum]|nr:putative prolyl 4-hydroxylase 3 [Nymphaea thermarum]